MFRRDWTTCSKFVNYSRFNSQNNVRDLYDHLRMKRIFSLIINEILVRALKTEGK